MRLNVLSFVAGVWWLQQQAALPDPALAWAVAVAGTAVGVLRAEHVAVRLARQLGVIAACFALGFAWAAVWAQARLADALPASWEGRDIVVVGVVAALPHAHERGVRFELDVERVLTREARVPRRIVLSWWGSPAAEGRPATFPALEPGERWRLTVRLKRPRGTANPHGFDYEAWLFERGLRATGYVRPKAGTERLAPMVHGLSYWVERVRSGIRARILATLAERPYAGVIIALAVGDQRAIPPEQWQTFTRTGVNHLMSISGLHVTMISGMVFALVCGLWRRVPRLVLALPAVKAAALAGLLAAFGYAALAGFAVPAQRTVYMLGVVALTLWLGVSGSASVVLCAALFVVTLVDPWAVLAPGFWLSFGAVAVILYVSVGRVAAPHWLASWGRVQLAVTLALIPPLLAMFQQVSIVSPVANALAIPLVSLVVVPLALAGIVLPFDFVLEAAHRVMEGGMVVLDWMDELPEAVWQQHAPPAWTVIVASAGIALLLAPRGLPGRWLGGVALLPLFTVASPPLPAGAAEIAALDVGQGNAVVVRTAGHALLYDAGPPFGPAADSGTRTIVPYLRATGVVRLDGLIVSHDDDDHWGGTASVMQAVPVPWLLSSLPDLDPLVVQAARAWRCERGQRWEWDGVRFEILHPARESYEDRSLKNNDRSCVLRVEVGGRRVLLPADIERRAENSLLEGGRGGLRADVLLAPHHGSRSSSTAEFVRAVAPRVVLFQQGYRNRHGHPNGEVLERYRESGASIYRSDRDGAVSVLIQADGAMTVTPWRAVYKRYWQTEMMGDPVPEPRTF